MWRKEQQPRLKNVRTKNIRCVVLYKTTEQGQQARADVAEEIGVRLIQQCEAVS